MKNSKVSINGNHYLTVNLKNPDGIYQKIYGRTEEEAIEKSKTIQRHWESLSKRWEIVRFHANDYTFDSYRDAFPIYDLKLNAEPLRNALQFNYDCKIFGQKKLYQITQKDIHEFLQTLQTGYLADSLKPIEQHCLLLLQNYYRDFMQKDFEYQPLDMVKDDKSLYIPNFLYFTQIKNNSLSSYFETYNKAYLPLYLVCITGLAVSDILSLSPENVDKSHSQIHLAGHTYKIDNPDFFTALLSDDSDEYFLNANKTLMARKSVVSALNTVKKKCGLPEKIKINNIRQAYVIYHATGYSDDEIKNLTRLSNNSIQDLRLWSKKEQEEKDFQRKYNLELADKLLLDKNHKTLIYKMIEEEYS